MTGHHPLEKKKKNLQNSETSNSSPTSSSNRFHTCPPPPLEGESQTRSPTHSGPRGPHGAAQRLRTRLGGSRAWEPGDGNGTERAQYRLVHDAALRRFAGTREGSRPAGAWPTAVAVLRPRCAPGSPRCARCPARAAVGGLRGCLGDEQCSAWTGLPPPTPGARAPPRVPAPARPPGATCTAALWALARREQIWALSPEAVS